MKQEIIYVAGPYSADDLAMVEANAAKAIYIGLMILKKGHIPFIPHLNFLADQYAQAHDIAMTYQEWMDWDKAFLDKCDALYYIDSSPGTETERTYAWDCGKKIYYSLDEIEPYKKSAFESIKQGLEEAIIYTRR